MNIKEIQKLTQQGKRKREIDLKKAETSRIRKELEHKRELNKKAKLRAEDSVSWLKEEITDTAKKGKNSYKTNVGEIGDELNLYHHFLKEIVKKELKDFTPEFIEEYVECNNDNDLWSETSITRQTWHIKCLFLKLSW